MNLVLIAPLGLVVVGVLASWLVPTVASPSTCVRVLTSAAVVAVGAAGAALVLVAMAGASELGAVADAIGWCRALAPGDHGAAPWAGAIALTALIAATTRSVRHLLRARREVAAYAHVDGVEIVAADGPVAFAVPGNPGGVVVGDGLLRALSPAERQVVLAHEQAHIDFHHQRYVNAAESCAAALPLLVPIARQVRFNSERWADEAAVQRVGSRQVVARAIAKAALLGVPEPHVQLGFSGLSVPARVDALLDPRPPAVPAVAAMVGAAAMLVTVAGASVQVHHVAVFVLHACGAAPG